MTKRILSLLLSTLACVWLSMPLMAQDTGIISGTVTDESGAVIPNATLTITNKATGAPRTVISNAEGLFSAPALPGRRLPRPS